jgi:hypothetical protein
VGLRDIVRASVGRLNGSSSGEEPGADSDDPQARDERRDLPRVERLGWARYTAGDVEGQGLVTNLSRHGAMVENCSELLDPGQKLTLLLKPSGGYETVSVDAEVVRASETGFALRWNDADDDAKTLLDRVIEAATARD